MCSTNMLSQPHIQVILTSTMDHEYSGSEATKFHNGYIIYRFIIVVDMIASYLTNLVIIWRLHYITYNIYIYIYMYICVYIYINIIYIYKWPIIAYQHSLIGWSTPHLARPVPPRSGSSKTPRDSKGWTPCQLASRDPADRPSLSVFV